MNTSISRVTICIRAVGFLALLSALSVAIVGAMAQEQAKPYKPPGALPWDIVKNCPPSHRIEYTLPATTLYVDVHWLNRIEISHLYDAYGIRCPSGPITLKTLEFGDTVLRLLDIRSGLGRELLRLRVGGDPSVRKKPLEAQPTGKPSGAKLRAPWIEDMNVSPPFKGVFGPGTKLPDSRAYKLHYLGPGDGSEDTVEVSCGGPEGRRTCRTLQPYAYDGLNIAYTLSQEHLPVPRGAQTTSGDPAIEPGALLQFNSRFRKWLITLQQNP